MSLPFAVQPLVLVIERESHVGRPLLSALASNGYRTIEARPRATAVALAMAYEPHLIVLDASSGSVDGTGLTVELRARTAAPIIAILDPLHYAQRTAILSAGASDCLASPFRPTDLLARMRVWVRQRARAPASFATREARTERLRIDRDRRAIIVEGRDVHVTPLECKLLVVLAQNGGRAMSEESTLAALWGPDSATRAPSYLRTLVRQLRQKLEREPGRPRYLVTEPGGGYRLNMGS